MPSRRHNSAMLCSPRRPSSTADLLLRRILLARCSANVLHDPLGGRFGGSGFLAHLHSLMVTMSQKSSVLQPAKSVSQVLTPDNTGKVSYPRLLSGGHLQPSLHVRMETTEIVHDPDPFQNRPALGASRKIDVEAPV